MSKTNLKTRNLRTGVLIGVGIVGMIGLSFASVPLYQLFCQITGYGGTPRIGEVVAEATGEAAEKVITVTLDANVVPPLKWDFRARVDAMDVGLGQEVLAFYSAKNESTEPVVGTATYNVLPVKAATYVSKIDCFCFTEQKLEPGQEIPMPVSFYIDPEIMDDPDTRYLEHIVLSYTFHPSHKAASVDDGQRDDGTDETDS